MPIRKPALEIDEHIVEVLSDSVNRNEIQGDTCPALMAPYRQLSKLRYDYPLILLDEGTAAAFVDTLSELVNRLLREIAPQGDEGARLRHHVLRLETRMRELADKSVKLSLRKLWLRAEKSLLAECGMAGTESLKNSLARARCALSLDGQVVRCDASSPVLLLQHAWEKVEARRTRRSLEQIDTLIINLRNMLRVDDLKNGHSRSSQEFKQTTERNDKEAFDFKLMPELLQDAAPHNKLPADRRERIETVLSVLESQKFFARKGDDKHAGNKSRYRFVFKSAARALTAFNERLAAIAIVVKAIAVAELECENAYRAHRHADYFDHFSEQALTPADLAQFPSYLVCLHDYACGARDKMSLIELASSELPMKVLFQVSDVLGEPGPGDKQKHSAAFAHQLANIFVAPGNAYVLQSTNSNLYQHRQEIRKGLEFTGPALFSVYSGCSKLTTAMPVYLLAAAAMESRVFPAFSYNPGAGNELVERFEVNTNPVIAAVWPRRQLHYEDEDLQAVLEEHAFTVVDFALMDPRYIGDFAPVPRELWNDQMLPVADYLDLADAETTGKIPYVPVVDGSNMLRRMVVDNRLIRFARRCRDRWHVTHHHGRGLCRCIALYDL